MTPCGLVLVTTVPVEAKGGIAALHGVLAEWRQELNICFFTIGSAAPFTETASRRYLRLFGQYLCFIYTIIAKRRVAAVHINTSPDQRGLLRDVMLVYLAKLLGKKVVVQVHGKLNDYQVAPWLRKMTERAFAMCDRILVFSLQDRMEIERITGSSEKALTFPNPVKVGDFIGTSDDLRERLSIPNENKVVLFMARLVLAKGIYELLQAVPAVVRCFDKVTFVLAGDGPEMEGVSRHCRDNQLEKWVVLPGNLKYGDVLRAFKTADIFVLPSYSEGLPMSILQALASGVSIVATPVGAIADILHEGENGFLVQPKNPTDLADKILILLRDDSLRSRIGSANFKLAKSDFDVTIVVGRLNEVYSSL